ncbi:hypothetical protein EV128_1341 [Rhizobium azibense]|nr:hypothetical protein EV128_1341 [Rhizobium azibense]
MKTDVYITGMSNTDAIAAALRTYDGPLKFEIDRLNPKINTESFTGAKANPVYFRPRLQAKLVVFALWGNWYNTIAIVEHPEPFDFIYPGVDETVDAGRRIIPFAQMKRIVNNNVRYRLEMVKTLAPLTNSKILMMEPPPPIEDENHILKFPGAFSEAVTVGVTPAPIRRKLWKLQSQVYSDLSEETGMEFFPFLPEAMSPSGYLAPEYCYRDPTHANAKYGEMVVSELEKIHRTIQ